MNMIIKLIRMPIIDNAVSDIENQAERIRNMNKKIAELSGMSGLLSKLEDELYLEVYLGGVLEV